MAKPKPSRHAPEEIEAYLADWPNDVRTTLERVRQIVRAAAPACTERVSYGIPIFRLGKDMVGISAQKNHCSLHSMSPSLMKAMAAELKGWKVSGATVHFTPDDPLPVELIRKMVDARMREISTES